MGLFSGGNSAQTSTETNTDNSQSIGQSNTSGVTVGGTGNSVSVLDGGAIENALAFAESSMYATTDVVSQALTENGRSLDSALNFGVDAFAFGENALEVTANTTLAAFENVSNATRSDSQMFMGKMLDTGKYIALGLGLVFLASKYVGK